MKECPDTIGEATVLMFTSINDKHTFTGDCKQIVAGEIMGPMAGLAICQYDGETAYFLLGCDRDWSQVTDTWHQTLDEAIYQAEFEYAGTKNTWIKK